ncbi:class I SAM-dependent methyltransferase [Saccharicrinis sp. FJH54]|uniref:class I SAM-dependent methyltransferase n=1 Tax=Saccharicrinis sp. FJH54 TaxID=3344665 RepID=UPI0035D43374
MSNVFDPKKLLKLESEDRYKAVPPKETLLKTGLKPEYTVADIGCGTGFFSIPAANYVKPNKVAAADISAEMLNFVNGRLIDEKISNIDIVRMDPMVIPLPDASFDYTFCSFVVHEVPDAAGFINEMLRITKPGGRVVIVEWQVTETPSGPPAEIRIEPEKLNEYINTEAVSSKEIMVLGDWFYATIAHKR